MSAGAARRSVDVVHGALREAILEGGLEQGTILSQVQLAERYGVSRTPLREALRLLQGEGLIDALPNRRVQVASFSVDDLEQIYAMRITLESLAVRLSVAQFDADDLRGLNARLAEMDAFAERGTSTAGTGRTRPSTAAWCRTRARASSPSSASSARPPTATGAWP